MYVWIWRHLPGAVGWKVLQTLLIVAAISALLLFIVFPWLEPKLPINKATVN
jgi:hypothetical protein